MTYKKRAFLWSGIYLLLIIAALTLAGIGHAEERRGFWIEFGVGLGFAGLAVMGLQFVLTARFRRIAAPFGLDELLHFHRQAGFTATLFIAGHVVVLFLADPGYLSFLDPRVNAPRALALSTVIGSLALLIVLTVRRKEVGLSYEWWRATHGIFALIITLIGLAHILMVGFYISELWQQAVWVGLTGGAIGLLIYARLIKPWRLKKHPYRVRDIVRETDEVYTLELEPVGHDGLTFKAGQFVWLTLGSTPFQLQQHPFTIASSPEETGRYKLTIKKLGDFTQALASAEKGTGAFLEGPYGTFALDPEAPPLTVFVAGGIGITPIMSMLRTANRLQDPRSMLLLYGNPDLQSTVFYREIEQLQQTLNLKAVHILERPPEQWSGEKGLIDRKILDKYLPETAERCHYYICGPEPMMDSVEPELRYRHVPLEQLHTERFNIV